MSTFMVAPAAHGPPESLRCEVEPLELHRHRHRHCHRHRRRRGGSPGILAAASLGAVVLAVAAVLGWNLSGGRLLVMETPSMCPRVCVGALVAEHPLHGPLRVGELISFHVPNNNSETYTHEVSRIFASGAIQTRGVASQDHDPWLITRPDIVGKVDFTVWELDWLLKVLPLLAVGVLIWILGRPFIKEGSRRSFDRGSMSVLTALPLWLLHPLVRATVIASTITVPHHPHWASDSVVNTGLLPVTFSALGGQAVRVGSTGIGQVSGPLHAHGLLKLQEAVSLPWWVSAIFALGVISPLVGCLWHVWCGDEAVPLHRVGREGSASSARGSRRARVARPV